MPTSRDQGASGERENDNNRERDSTSMDEQDSTASASGSKPDTLPNAQKKEAV